MKKIEAMMCGGDWIEGRIHLDRRRRDKLGFERSLVSKVRNHLGILLVDKGWVKRRSCQLIIYNPSKLINCSRNIMRWRLSDDNALI